MGEQIYHFEVPIANIDRYGNPSIIYKEREFSTLTFWGEKYTEEERTEKKN